MTTLRRPTVRGSSCPARVGAGAAARGVVVGGQHAGDDVGAIGADGRRPQSVSTAPTSVVVPATPDARYRRQPTAQARLAIRQIQRENDS